MKTTLLVATVAVLALGSCAQKGPGASPSSSAGSSPSVSQCLQPHQPDRTCVQGAGVVCHVDVLYQGNGNTTVYPYLLDVPNGASRIVWGIRGQGKEFRQADGPLQLKTDPRFSNGSPSDKPDGSTSTSTGMYYRMDYNGQPLGNGVSYTIQFTDRQGSTRSCDPIIFNTGG
jgi:hypothetical protein